MHITGLRAENFKKLKVVDVTFDPKTNAVVISGANRQGKSTLLDCFMAAMGGGEALKDTPIPIRRGEDHAEVVVTTDELIVTRTWTASGNTYVTVTNKEGWTPTGGVQSLLDRLYSAFSFDPLAFSNMEEKRQLATLLKLVDIGIDLKANAAERKTNYDARTLVNREVTDLEGQVKLMPELPDALPVEEVPATVVLEEQAEAQKVINANAEKRRELEEQNRNLREKVRADNAAVRDSLNAATDAKVKFQQSLEYFTTEINLLEKRLVDLKDIRTTTEAEAKTHYGEMVDIQQQVNTLSDPDTMELPGTETLGLVDPDMTVFAERIKNLEETNRLVRARKEHDALRSKLSEKKARAEELTATINGLDKQKEDALSAAKMPLEGLSFDENGLLYNGIPAAQWSDEESISISVAMGMALNPKLKAMFVREASLMDPKSRDRMIKLAEEKGYQVFMEVVDTSGKMGIFIEDGEVTAIDGQAVTEQPKPRKRVPKKGKQEEGAVNG